ncbi:DNA-binding LacI/PurR family transcriptional regulator [Phyllobacterium ifriqiyense]|uniref:DNA-binding LacI/PurR family transcriptional regulator n=1 Tax=Phyllobacterium ifriqiyense TaxID=314238 RepID=A0ABU0S9Z7_9HYPH|nr:LacI family DNA-binding transcriptional regulator [Phyllobacterium ifriqiyense]MDQ0997594.1 DNA-binding LacI/PurR family transcriptional regulator [Phyllobacterium ifriqiyense]
MPKDIKTMEDFSEFAGLSRPTVSKYFNDPSSVRKSTRKIVEAAILRSGYKPNLFASNRRTHILGVIVPNSNDPFYMSLTRRIQDLAGLAGYMVFMQSSEGRPELEQRALETFQSMNVAGVIIGALGSSSHQEKLAKAAESVPIVYIDSSLDDTSPFVGTDNRQSVKLIVDYLTRSGDAPCYFGMPPLNNNVQGRRSAYVAAMDDLGLEPLFVPVDPENTWNLEKFAFDAAIRILRNGSFPTKTVLCGNDRIAAGLSAAAYQAGLKIGRRQNDDLRLAGHDDQPFARYMCPPLTTVAQNHKEIGRLAVELMFQKLGETRDTKTVLPANERILLNAEIMLRMSA